MINFVALKTDSNRPLACDLYGLLLATSVDLGSERCAMWLIDNYVSCMP